MSAVQSLSTLAVRSLFEGFCNSIGFPLGPAAADAASRFLTGRFVDHSQKLHEILGRATDRAWRALELALAGDSWWDRVKTLLHSREEQAFREQVGAFLRVTPLDNLPFHPPAFRANALRDLRAARKAGLLAGSLDTATLAQQGAAFARYADPVAVLEAEWQTLGTLIEQLRGAGHRDLADFLALRPVAEMPLLVVAVRYFFRREMEDDPALMAALSFAKLEQLSSTQEAGFDALSSLLAKNTQRLDGLLEQALTLLTETHADVKEIKADLALLGQNVFRALATQAEGPGAPVRDERDLRLEMLNTLTTTPHRELMPLWQLHEHLCAQDPRFYVRLAAWYHVKGEVRDHKEMFVIALCLSSFEGHREVGLALLRKLPPHQVLRVVDFISGRVLTRKKLASRRPTRKAAQRATREVVGRVGLFRSLPRSLRTEVERYLRQREANPAWFDSSVLVARKALKRLYALLHVRPSPRAQAILFDNDPPADSRLSALKRIATAPTPQAVADEILASKLPFRVAVSVLPQITPETLEALADRMTPQEVINHLAMLQRHGGMAHLNVRAIIETKLEAAKRDRRVSALKADVAGKAVEAAGGAGFEAQLDEVADARLKAQGKLRRSTGLLVDKSGSMEVAIDTGNRIAAMLSSIAQKELYVYAFDTMAYEITSPTRDWAGWKKAFEGIHANGETSVGVSLELMRRRKQAVEQLIIVTDEEEYNPPFFVESYLKYRQELKVSPTITFVKVPDSTTKLEQQCKRAGLPYSVFEFTGDYYALPNLIALVEPPSQLDLLLDIMEWPLPKREAE
jgi:hypothetical protein